MKKNGWYCPHCQTVTEHTEFSDDKDRLQYCCAKCGNVFRAPARLCYMKWVRRGGVLSMRRIVVSRMGINKNPKQRKPAQSITIDDDE